MARWAEIEAAEPEFAAAVQALFDAHRHKVLATVRKDGSPRVSGIELTFADGDVWFGSMAAARKLADLRRDPRLALHCASVDPPEDATAWEGDAKLAGVAVEVDDPERLNAMGGGSEEEVPGHLFRVEISEAVLTRVNEAAEHLDVLVWTPERGLRRLQSSG